MITFNDVVIETTRRCNLSCEHCLRGEAQPIDNIAIKTIAESIAGSYISTLTFSGGEPSLTPRVIDRVINNLSRCKVEVGNFYIVTNGTRPPKENEFLSAITKLYTFCTDNETSGLDISNTMFHRPYQDEDWIRTLQMFKFTHIRNDLQVEHLISEGRAKENYLTDRERNYDTEFTVEVYGSDEIVVESLIYINVFGEVFTDCDLSYQSQKEKHKCYLGHVSKIRQIIKQKTRMAA